MLKILSFKQKQEIYGFILLAFFIITSACLFFNADEQLLGVIGWWIRYILYNSLFGKASFIIPAIFFILAIVKFKHIIISKLNVKIIGFLSLLVSFSVALNSGLIGMFFYDTLNNIIGKVGVYLTSILGAIFSSYLLGIDKLIFEFVKKISAPSFNKSINKKEKKHISIRSKEVKKARVQEKNNNRQKQVVSTSEKFNLPPLSLFHESVYSPEEEFNAREVAKILENTLKNFSIDVKVIGISQGPVITRYELQPAAGIKISRITNLADDIALSLKSANIRIVAPIPGKSAVGIEVPNTTFSPVHIREILESDKWNKKYVLPVALGKSIDGSTIIFDLAEMPHLLIAGATGSGKSVCINSVIISLLYSKTPDELKIVLIDPKRVEFSVYNDLPHLYTQIIIDPKLASSALKGLIIEMEDRYKKLANVGARDIGNFNKKSDEKMPYIAVLIDELAELMLVSPKEVEESITRLAQLARGVGIHLVLATQRPSVDVITGVIKANMPARIAFQVASKVDSRTILDTNGAETLIGKGDMLFLSPAKDKPMRIQGSFVNKEEIDDIVMFLKRQKTAEYKEIRPSQNLGKEMEDSQEDEEILKKALLLVKERKRVSVTLLQGALHISGGRASNLVSWMETKELIGAPQGTKPREIYIERIDAFLDRLS